MGKVMSIAAQRFNVENRAHRILSQDKIRPAPKYEANVKELEQILKDHPEIVEQAGKKDQELDDRLKKVFVTSTDYMEQRRIINPDKPLPLDRKTPDTFEYGYKEPDPTKVSLGKCTLRQAVQFITDHQQQPNEWTPERIANDFKLKKEVVLDILENYKMFGVHIPKKEGKTKKYFVSPFQKKTDDFEELMKEGKRLN